MKNEKFKVKDRIVAVPQSSGFRRDCCGLRPCHDGSAALFTPHRVILALIMLLAFPVFRPAAFAGLASPFTDIRLESPFVGLLRDDPDFMREGGARIIKLTGGGLALIGIAKVLPADDGQGNETDMLRIGEIQARAAILKLGGEVEISSTRGAGQRYDSGNKASLAAFFQVTTSEVRGRIEQIPVIGTWRAATGEALYVAVGTNRSPGNTGLIPSPAPEAGLMEDTPVIQGQEPFVTLLQNSPVLRKNGGVRAFLLPDGRRVLIAVGLAPQKNSRDTATKVARLKAIRALLGSRDGVTLSSVQILSDRETQILDAQGDRTTTLSDFLSIQQEKVSGSINALPVVAEWTDQHGGKMVFVGIGREM